MDDLHITYNHGNGEMLIHLDYFFPCSQVRFNKLLKIIELDWQHEAELKENLKEARADFRAYTAAYKQALSDAKSNKRFKERFEKYLESM